MTVLNPAPRDDASTARRPDGNDVDLHYLEEARAALRPVMAISHAVSGRATGHDLRALARDALSAQTRQLAAISACLLAWDRPKTAGPRPAATEALPGLHGPTLDRVFADQLTAHAHASITAARAEMVAGASRSARAIAEDAIGAQYRQLAALDLLFPPAIRQR
jgi:uncharacterized protein (DUF305 family)